MEHEKISRKFLVAQKSPSDFSGCKKQENLENCPCKDNCSKKGICCECVDHHRNFGGLPACLR